MATDSFMQMFDFLDLFFLVTMPIIFYLILQAERRNRRRLDRIIAELRQTNTHLTQLNAKD